MHVHLKRAIVPVPSMYTLYLQKSNPTYARLLDVTTEIMVIYPVATMYKIYSCGDTDMQMLGVRCCHATFLTYRPEETLRSANRFVGLLI